MKSTVYIDNKSVLVITEHGLRRISCPFLIIVIIDINNFKIGDRLTVVNVAGTQKIKLLYCINGLYFSHHYFVIIST